MKNSLLALCLSVTCLWGQGAAATAAQELQASLAALGQLQGRFTQSRYGEDGVLLDQSTGRFMVLRPGYFAWEIESPDSQLVIAGPEFLWHHDRDLETVTRRPVGQGAAMAPLQVLGGDGNVLLETFAISGGAGSVYTLAPRAEGAGFRELGLILEGGLPARMEILDDLRQRIVIEFSGLDTESVLDPALFDFEVPPGADLFVYDE